MAREPALDTEERARAVATSSEPPVVPGSAGVLDDRTFARIFAEHAQTVLRLLRRMGVGEADLEDVTQEVFVVLHRRYADFRGESSLKTFICGIAVRKAMSHRRRKHVRDEVSLEHHGIPSTAPAQQQRVEQRQRQEQLARLLQALDDKKRAVFVLYELEELPMKEIAALVEAPLHTCYSRLHAARDELKTQLSRLERRGERA